MKRIQIGLVGLGTVGSGLLEILRNDKGEFAARTGLALEVVQICDRSWQKKRQILQGIPASADYREVLARPGLDILIELMGGLKPAYEIVSAALKQSIPVVTANKALLARHGNELFALAQKHKTELAFEAAIAGALPVIKNMRRSLVANRFLSIYGILNGTCNFILTRMEEDGMAYADALKLAQDKGFAEADPTFDVEGLDAAQKLAILSALAFDTQIAEDAVLVEGITNLEKQDFANAAAMKHVIRLLAMATPDPVQMSVRPVMIPAGHVLASVKEEKNAIFFETSNSGPHLVMGQGAGALPTAAAVLSDIVYLARKDPSQPECWLSGKQQPKAASGKLSRYYLRFETEDKPGVLAELARILAMQGISIASMIQNEGKNTASLVIITHTAREADLDKALTEIRCLPFAKAPPRKVQFLNQL